MNIHHTKRPRIVIIGGGVSGAATAWNLARHRVDADVVVVEPRQTLGHGLAYATTEVAHRINVPAAKMSLDPDQPDHFMDWLASPEGPMLDTATVTPKGDFFPQRKVFGDYVAHCLQPMLYSGQITHVRGKVIGVARSRRNSGFNIAVMDGAPIHADTVIIATSHPPPDLPPELRSLTGSDRMITDPYDLDRVLGIGARDRVLIVGTGLTCADLVASLHRRGFWGRIVALSRHGHRSHGHGVVTWPSETDFAPDPSQSARSLLRRIRQSVEADGARGQRWHAVIDRVRAEGAAIWNSLDHDNRARILRHLRTVWDVHRFRVSPQVEAVLDQWTARGILKYQAARLTGAVKRSDGIEVHFRPRGQPEVKTAVFDRIVVTTGPAHGSVIQNNPALASMEKAGLISRDPFGLGLAVDQVCCAIGRTGKISDGIFVAGPLARGHVGELMGLPEVTRHAKSVAASVAMQFNRESLIWRTTQA